MKIHLLNLTVMGMLGVLAGCRGNKSADPPVHPNLNMDFQQNFKPQETNPWFADKRAVRVLPKGTVARNHLKSNDDAFFAGRGPDGRFLDGLPEGVALDETLLERGEQRFEIYCTPCHAATGEGNGIVTQRGLASLKVPPPSYFEPRLQAMPLGYFFDVITHGKNTMKGYASQIPAHDRWAIAAWVRTLQVSQRAQLADIPAAERAKIEGGAP